MTSRKPSVAFICVHNSCRSQIAEALGTELASDVFQSYSAGTQKQPQINQDAQRLMLLNYHIDMEQTQYSKLLSDIPDADIIITMGCHVQCPKLPCCYQEDWGLADPSGQSDAEYMRIIYEIERNILHLSKRIQCGDIVISD